MNVEHKAPKILIEELSWFANVISFPMQKDHKLPPISSSFGTLEKMASDHIAPSPTLQPHQRIEIYHQQYWWRLLRLLRESFPLLLRLHGIDSFNYEIGVPYLARYPSTSWSLSLLGRHLIKWLQEHYKGAHASIAIDCARIDMAYSESMIAKDLPPLSIKDEEAEQRALHDPLFLQPSAHLFEMEYHLFNFRQKVMEQASNYWQCHPLPLLQRNAMSSFYVILYRTKKSLLCWKEISHCQYLLLVSFQSGMRLEEAIAYLEKHHLEKEALPHLQQWFHEWTVEGLLSLVDPKEKETRC